MKKIINRNAFNEKLIHRYFFERIYLDKEIRKKLIPKSLKSKISKINLVVPEYSEPYDNYFSDFTLYFKNDNKPYPVEIKWKSSDFKKKNQVDEINKHNGYLVSFDELDENVKNSIVIDKTDFQNWLVERIDSLFEEALSTKVKTKIGNKSWVVTLRGSDALKNFTKMKNNCGNKTNFWAFKNNLESMKNILLLEKGDEMIFLFIKTGGNERSGMIPNSNSDFELKECYFTKIEEPYYMVLDGEQSHFFDFKRFEEFKFEDSVKISRKNMIKSLKMKLAASANHGGILMELRKDEVQQLKGKIRIKKLLNKSNPK